MGDARGLPTLTTLHTRFRTSLSPAEKRNLRLVQQRSLQDYPPHSQSTTPKLLFPTASKHFSPPLAPNVLITLAYPHPCICTLNYRPHVRLLLLLPTDARKYSTPRIGRTRESENLVGICILYILSLRHPTAYTDAWRSANRPCEHAARPA